MSDENYNSPNKDIGIAAAERMRQAAVELLHELEIKADTLVSDEAYEQFPDLMRREKEYELEHHKAHIIKTDPDNFQKTEAGIFQRVRVMEPSASGFDSLLDDTNSIVAALCRVEQTKAVQDRIDFYAFMRNILMLPVDRRREFLQP